MSRKGARRPPSPRPPRPPPSPRPSPGRRCTASPAPTWAGKSQFCGCRKAFPRTSIQSCLTSFLFTALLSSTSVRVKAARISCTTRTVHAGGTSAMSYSSLFRPCKDVRRVVKLICYTLALMVTLVQQADTDPKFSI
ncbi:MAG: hypothetical protein EBR09_17185 [Proteobacteria bacterium]|nr:hypothetical protein [Pseudomonadota bacterium]